VSTTAISEKRTVSCKASKWVRPWMPRPNSAIFLAPNRVILRATQAVMAAVRARVISAAGIT